MNFDFCKQIYVEICDGVSEVISPKSSFKSFFFKHPTHKDYVLIKKYYNEGLERAVLKGLKKEEEIIESIVERGWWSKGNEDKIKGSKEYLDMMHKSRANALLPSQKDAISKEIKREEASLNELLEERSRFIQYTAETYANKQVNEFYFLYLFYQDSDLKTPLFASKDDFYESEEGITSIMWEYLFEVLSKFSDKNIKYVAATGFFQNLLSVSGDAIYNFYGKPTIQLTTYQLDIFSYARMYKSAISNSSEKIPDYILNDPSQLVEWVEAGGSSSKAKKMLEEAPNSSNSRGERSGRISSIVGAISSDYKKLGISGAKREKSLLALAKESGGTLNIASTVKNTE